MSFHIPHVRDTDSWSDYASLGQVRWGSLQKAEPDVEAKFVKEGFFIGPPNHEVWPRRRLRARRRLGGRRLRARVPYPRRLGRFSKRRCVWCDTRGF